jgi:hypothetical protein
VGQISASTDQPAGAIPAWVLKAFAEKSNSKLLQAILLEPMVTACRGAPWNYNMPKKGTERSKAKRVG